MKKLFFTLLLFLFSSIGFSQYIYPPNTVTVIPPTSGCNGIWNVLDTAYSSPFVPCSFPLYSFNPVGCAVVNHRNGDTLFLDLCSIPCEVTELCDSGIIVQVCDIDYATAIDKNVNNQQEIFYSSTNSTIHINTSLIKTSNAIFRLYDLSGKEILQRRIRKNETIIHTYNYPKGIYFYQLNNLSGKLIIAF